MNYLKIHLPLFCTLMGLWNIIIPLTWTSTPLLLIPPPLIPCWDTRADHSQYIGCKLKYISHIFNPQHMCLVTRITDSYILGYPQTKEWMSSLFFLMICIQTLTYINYIVLNIYVKLNCLFRYIFTTWWCAPLIFLFILKLFILAKI